jgi:hypothetical protein
VIELGPGDDVDGDWRLERRIARIDETLARFANEGIEQPGNG